MSPFLVILLSFLCSIISAAILMPWLLALCHRHELTNASGQSGRFRIPRLGGIILAPATAIGLSAAIISRLHYNAISETIKSSTLLIMLGMMLIYLAGIIDDVFGLNRWQKRCLLLSASMAFPLCGLYLNDLYGFCGIHHLGYYSGFLLTTVVTFLLAKAIEAQNNTDGMAGGLCLIPLVVFGGIFFLQGYHSYATIAISMSGALLVYLYYNIFGDEKIGTKTYMGHAGSLIMSYCIIYLSLKYAMDNTKVIDRHSDGLIVSCSMLILPLFEYLRVLAVSCWHGLSREQRIKEYVGRKLQEKGYSQKAALITVLVASLLVIGLNLGLHFFLKTNVTWVVAADIVLYGVWIYVIDRKEKKEVVASESVRNISGAKGEEGLVSIIMPTWNSGRFVRESIESILAQTYTRWELIITDDCSSDKTMDILNEYAAKDSRIIVKQNKENGGAGVSRNNSIEAAHGQYMAFCDSDDCWTPNKLKAQLDFMRRNEVALCFSPYYTCDEHSRYLGYISAPRRVNLFQMMCDNKMGFLTCIYDTYRLGKHFMPQQRKRQDHAMLLNLLKICKYAYSIPEPLANYRIHSDNMSANKISLLKYNAQTYTAVFGWNKAVSYAFLFVFFMPTYFTKKAKNLFINISRTRLG